MLQSRNIRKSTARTMSSRVFWIAGAGALLLLVRLAMLVHLSSHSENILTPDSQLYLDLGRLLVSGEVQLPEEGLARRPPGYPLFCGLAETVVRQGAFSVAVLQNCFQIVAAIALGGVLYWRFRSGPVAVLSSLFWLADPATYVYSNYVLSEVVFTLLLVAAWWLYTRALVSPGFWNCVGAGLVLGSTIWIRPVSLYAPLLLIPVFLATHGRQNLRKTCALAIPLLIAFLIPLLLLLSFNGRMAGARVVSTIEGINLLYYRAAGAIGEEIGASRSEVAERLEAEFEMEHGTELGIEEQNRLQKQMGVRLLCEHPVGALISAGKGAVRTFFGPGFKALSRLLHGQQKYRESAETSLGVRAIQLTILGILYLLAGLGMLYGWKSEHLRPVVIACLAFILYFGLITAGPEANSRFRVPIMPYIAVLAAIGFAEKVIPRVAGLVQRFGSEGQSTEHRI